jgi:hypothetical protein
MSTRGASAAGLLALLLPLSACGAGPSSVADPDLRCGQDRSSEAAKDVVERVGGLRTDDFVVRFARSTEAGVVALVDRDADDAYRLLHPRYGVTIVGRIGDDDGRGPADGSAQVDRLVRASCPAG